MPDTLVSLLAQTPADGFQSAWDFLRKGGLFMIPLALTSVGGAMAIVYKFLSLSPERIIPNHLAREVANFERRVAENALEPVLREFQEGNSALARLGAVAVKHRGKPQHEITQAVEASAREETVHLHSGIGVLDVVITVAPLLGLLGTASGLVVIFGGLGESGNPDYLAMALGIAEALSTTIVGLAVAVPCVIAHSYFTRRIERLTARLELLLTDLVNVCQRLHPNP
jgi:biopolymer transport protein ExbB